MLQRCIRLSLLAFLAPVIFQCRKVGPLEQQLDQAEPKARMHLAAPTSEERKKDLIAILKEISPLLTERTFVDATDVSRRDALQYRASLLLSGVLAHMAASEADPVLQMKRLEASRQLYMNAYLIDPAHAMNGLKAWLPEKSDMSLYAKVRVPDYSVVNEQTGKDGMYTVLQVKESLEYYLLQMVVADRLRKVRLSHATLATLHADLVRDGLTFAYGDWDAESDRVLLKMK